METVFIISPEDAGVRLDRFLAGKLPDFSRSRLQDAVKNSVITVNGAVKTPHYALRAGDTVAVMGLVADSGPRVEPRTDIALPILYEDDEVIVVNKPSGLLVHPAVSSDDRSVAHALLAHFPALAQVGEDALRPGIVHRLDKEASGVLAVAKTTRAFASLKQQFQEHTVAKEYVVLVEGVTSRDEGTITLAVGRKSGSGQMSARPKLREDDREAVTHYDVLERFAKATLLRVRTETGRTHQIRVHMKAIGYPVVGDALYGAARPTVASPRLFLHAAKLSFDHPVSGVRMTFEAPLPEDLAYVLAALRIPNAP